METEKRLEPPAGPGQRAVVAMLVLALVAAGVAWYVNFNRGRRALDLYGAGGAKLVRTAQRVELLRPAPDKPLDLSAAPGLLNARTALLADASYVWDAPPRLASPQFAVRFGDGPQAVDITFDFENRTVRSSSTGRSAVLTKKMADGWQAYLAKQSTTPAAD